MEFLISYIVSLMGVVGGAALLDSLMQPEFKKVIYGFITRQQSVKLPEFERYLIEGIIRIFLNEKGRVSLKRVVVYSYAGGAIIASMPASYVLLEGLSFPYCRVFLFLAPPLMSIPGDYFSILIIKRLFLDQRRSIYLFPLLWISSVFLCAIYPVITLLFVGSSAFREAVLMMLWNAVPNPVVNHYVDAFMELVVSAGLIINVSLSIFVSIAQLFLIIAGIAMRYVVMPLLKLWRVSNSILKLQSKPLAVSLLLLGALNFPVAIALRVFMSGDG